jgi:hypothetical protein
VRPSQDYDLPYPFKATPEHKARGERFLKLFSDLLASGKIKPGPIRVMPGGLAAVPGGLQDMLDGKVWCLYRHCISSPDLHRRSAASSWSIESQTRLFKAM